MSPINVNTNTFNIGQRVVLYPLAFDQPVAKVLRRIHVKVTGLSGKSSMRTLSLIEPIFSL
ncbi:MAG: hypothetical protein WBD31_02535 [Rubripirellula sp.]